MKRTMAALALVLGLVVLGQPAETGVALAQAGSTYTVNITNLTPGQSFTPILAATHSAAASVFLPGTTASAALGTLAETGDVAPLTALLTSMPAAVMQVLGVRADNPWRDDEPDNHWRHVRSAEHRGDAHSDERHVRGRQHSLAG